MLTWTQERAYAHTYRDSFYLFGSAPVMLTLTQERAYAHTYRDRNTQRHTYTDTFFTCFRCAPAHTPTHRRTEGQKITARETPRGVMEDKLTLSEVVCSTQTWTDRQTDRVVLEIFKSTFIKRPTKNSVLSEISLGFYAITLPAAFRMSDVDRQTDRVVLEIFKSWKYSRLL